MVNILKWIVIVKAANKQIRTGKNEKMKKYVTLFMLVLNHFFQTWCSQRHEHQQVSQREKDWKQKNAKFVFKKKENNFLITKTRYSWKTTIILLGSCTMHWSRQPINNTEIVRKDWHFVWGQAERFKQHIMWLGKNEQDESEPVEMKVYYNMKLLPSDDVVTGCVPDPNRILYSLGQFWNCQKIKECF